MALCKDDAVVIRRIDHSETSQVLVFFGRDHGQMHLIAKGIKRGTKKAFATGLDLLEAGAVTFTRRENRSGLGTLVEWRQTEAFLGLRANVRRLYAAQYAAEVVSQLTEQGDPHPEIHEALVGLLRTLNEATEAVSPLVTFQRRLLTSVGLIPMLDACAACERPGAAFTWFSAGLGGMICRDCEPSIVEKRRVAPALASALASGHIGPALAKAAFELLDYAISYTMGRPTRVGPYLMS